MTPDKPSSRTDDSGDTATDNLDHPLTLDRTEVVNICDLLDHAATLLTTEDGCCHQLHRTGRHLDSQLLGGWLTDLSTELRKRSNTTPRSARLSVLTSAPQGVRRHHSSTA